MPPKRKGVSQSPQTKKAKVARGNKVALIGGDGSLSHQAAMEYFSSDWTFEGVETFDAVFKSVEDGTCEYGLIPIENSNSGALLNVYDLLAQHKLFVVGEHATLDDLCLLAPAGRSLDAIKRVYSHPAVLQNCSVFLRKLAGDKVDEFEQVSMTSTGVACKTIKKRDDGDCAAIATRRAAGLHGLTILQGVVANDKNLTTRYIVLGKEPASLASQVNVNKRKHSLALTVRNEPGSIFKMLSPFAFRGIQVLKMDSRPGCVALDMFKDSARHWEYVHFVDFEPSMDTKANEGLMRDLQEYCVSVRDFGSYPKWEEAEERSYQVLWV